VNLEESFYLRNLFVEDINYNQISDVEGCHLDGNDLVRITGGSHPCTMHNPIQSSKCIAIILESFRNYQEFEALQLPLMVMSSSHDSGKIPQISQIHIFSQNYFLCMVSLGVNPFLKDDFYFEYGSFNFNDIVSSWI